MYKLQSGEQDNSTQLYVLESNAYAQNLIKKTFTIYNIESNIFGPEIDDKTYISMVAALTMGDQLKTPIDEETARLLYFALNTNVKNKNSKIRSMFKAAIFYNDFEGDFSKVTFIDTKNSIIQLAKIFYKEVVPGVSIQYKIPFYVVNGKNGYNFTIADCDKYTMLINDRAETITRKAFYKIFGTSYAKSFRNHEDVINCIDPNVDTLIECLINAGFEKNTVNFPFENALSLEYSSDNTLLAWEELSENNEDWRKLEKGKYMLNKAYNNIVPLVPHEDKMCIYLN